jgi:hypothetical protein
MIERAKQAVAEAGLQDRNIEFRTAYLDETQLPDGFADVVTVFVKRKSTHLTIEK